MIFMTLAAFVAFVLIAVFIFWGPFGPTMVHNARVKLVATALNNLGVAAIIYGIIAPRLNGQGDDPVVFLFGFSAGIVLILYGVWIHSAHRQQPS